MKSPLIVVLLLAFARLSFSALVLFETVPPSTPNIFRVPENQVAFLTCFGTSYVGSLITNGRTNRAEVRTGTELVLAGPAELQFTSGAALQFRFMTNTGFSTFAITNGESKSIPVPEGKMVRLVPSVINPDIFLTLSNNSITTPKFEMPLGFQVEGPVVITFQVSSPTGTSLNTGGFSYYFLDPSITVPAGVAIQAAAGNLELRVEKSDDLKEWRPSIIQPVSSAEKFFYRLTVNR